MRRGDLVRIAAGKPRPAIIVQADEIATPLEILLCPMTTSLLDAPLYRPTIYPTSANGLKAPSQIMADKVAPVSLDRIDGVFGYLDEADLSRLNVALAVVLDLRG